MKTHKRKREKHNPATKVDVQNISVVMHPERLTDRCERLIQERPISDDLRILEQIFEDEE